MGAINLCRGHCPRLCRFLPRTDPQGPQTSWQGQGNTGYQVSQSLVQQRAKSELPWRWRAVRHSMSQCQALPWDVAHGRATGSALRASAAMPRPPTPGCSASAVTGHPEPSEGTAAANHSTMLQEPANHSTLPLQPSIGNLGHLPVVSFPSSLLLPFVSSPCNVARPGCPDGTRWNPGFSRWPPEEPCVLTPPASSSSEVRLHLHFLPAPRRRPTL